MWPFKARKKQSNPAPTTITREIGGVRVVKEDRVITSRVRTTADAAKLDILKSFLDIIGSEDIDPMFVAVLTEAQHLGYNLKDEPEALLHRLNRQHA